MVHRISGKDQGLGWCIVEPAKAPNHTIVAEKACLGTVTVLSPQDVVERQLGQCRSLQLLQKAWVMVGTMSSHSLIGKRELPCLCCGCKGLWEMWGLGAKWD